MPTNTHNSTASDHSIGNILIISMLAFCGLTFIILLGIFWQLKSVCPKTCEAKVSGFLKKSEILIWQIALAEKAIEYFPSAVQYKYWYL
jgi:hypothetical protein